MAGIADLVRRTNPVLLNWELDVTEGGTWGDTLINIWDDDDDPVDFSTAVFDCKILTAPNGSTVVSPTMTGGVGTIGYAVSAASSAGLAGAGAVYPRNLVWYCSATMSGVTLFVWGPVNSPVRIYPV